MERIAATTSVVISPSPMPISIWIPVMAGKPSDQATVPDHASSPAQHNDAMTVDAHEPNATPMNVPNEPGMIDASAR